MNFIFLVLTHVTVNGTHPNEATRPENCTIWILGDSSCPSHRSSHNALVPVTEHIVCTRPGRTSRRNKNHIINGGSVAETIQFAVCSLNNITNLLELVQHCRVGPHSTSTVPRHGSDPGDNMTFGTFPLKSLGRHFGCSFLAVAPVYCVSFLCWFYPADLDIGR